MAKPKKIPTKERLTASLLNWTSFSIDGKPVPQSFKLRNKHKAEQYAAWSNMALFNEFYKEYVKNNDPRLNLLSAVPRYAASPVDAGQALFHELTTFKANFNGDLRTREYQSVVKKLELQLKNQESEVIDLGRFAYFIHNYVSKREMQSIRIRLGVRKHAAKKNAKPIKISTNHLSALNALTSEIRTKLELNQQQVTYEDFFNFLFQNSKRKNNLTKQFAQAMERKYAK